MDDDIVNEDEDDEGGDAQGFSERCWNKRLYRPVFRVDRHPCGGARVRVVVECDNRGSDMWVARRFDRLDPEGVVEMRLVSLTRMSAPLQASVRRFMNATTSLRVLRIQPRFLYLIDDNQSIRELHCLDGSTRLTFHHYSLQTHWFKHWRFPATLVRFTHGYAAQDRWVRACLHSRDGLGSPDVAAYFALMPAGMESVAVGIPSASDLSATIAQCPCPRLAISISDAIMNDTLTTFASTIPDKARSAVLASTTLTQLSLVIIGDNRRHAGTIIPIELPLSFIHHLESNNHTFLLK